MVKDDYLVIFPVTYRIVYFQIRSGRLYCTKAQYRVKMGVIILFLNAVIKSVATILSVCAIGDIIQRKS